MRYRNTQKLNQPDNKVFLAKGMSHVFTSTFLTDDGYRARYTSTAKCKLQCWLYEVLVISSWIVSMILSRICDRHQNPGFLGHHYQTPRSRG